jgi:hypothetical protein
MRHCSRQWLPMVKRCPLRRATPTRSSAGSAFISRPLASFLPERRRNVLHLSFALFDPERLEELFASAGFNEVRVERQTQVDAMQNFDEYWEPIEAGIGSIPQSYLELTRSDRRLVREKAKAQLARFEVDGKLAMSVEMLIGRGRA